MLLAPPRQTPVCRGGGADSRRSLPIGLQASLQLRNAQHCNISDVLTTSSPRFPELRMTLGFAHRLRRCDVNGAMIVNFTMMALPCLAVYRATPQLCGPTRCAGSSSLGLLFLLGSLSSSATQSPLAADAPTPPPAWTCHDNLQRELFQRTDFTSAYNFNPYAHLFIK